MTFEVLIQVGELQIQLRSEREKNIELTRQLDQIVGNELWAVPTPNSSFYKIDFCVSHRAIAQARSSEVFTLALFGQVQKMIIKLVKKGE